MNSMDQSKRLIFICLAVIAAVVSAGCGRTGADPYNTLHFEERWLGMGPAQESYRHGQALLKAGRYQEAHAAFAAAERAAYSSELTAAARSRRLYLEDFIRAQQEGRQPPAPPITQAPDSLRKPPPKVEEPPPPTGTGSQAGRLQPLPQSDVPFGTGSKAGQLQPLRPAYPPVEQTGPQPKLLPPSPPIVERQLN